MPESDGHLTQSADLGKIGTEPLSPALEPAPNTMPFVSARMYLLASEHASLRGEILKRIEIRQQLVALTLVVAGTFLSLGLQPSAPIALLTIYPILSAFLWASWLHNDLRVGQMVVYVRDVLERQFGAGHIGWENFARTQFLRAANSHTSTERKRPETHTRNVLVTRGVFVTTQILVVLLSIAQELRALQQTDVIIHPFDFLSGAFTSAHFDLVFINLPLLLCDFVAITITLRAKRWRG